MSAPAPEPLVATDLDQLLALNQAHVPNVGALDLARQHLLGSVIRQIENADLTAADLTGAAEAFIFGTTPDVTALVEFDGRAIGDGKPGPVWKQLSDLLTRDIAEGLGPHVSIDG